VSPCDKAKAAEIVAAKSKKTAADALDLLNAAKLFQKTAQAGPGGHCLPCHPTHCEPQSLDSIGSL